MKRLYRSTDNKMAGGVIGGIGEYFDVDLALLRLLYAAVTVFTGLIPGLVLYVAALFIVPKKKDQ
jgi:phage shock protein C